MKISRVSALTHPGKKREKNEDCVLVSDEILLGEQELPAPFVHDCQWVFVADGMGGHGDGAIASQTALSLILKDLPALVSVSWENLPNFIRSCLEKIHSTLLSGVVSDKKLGTTICGVIRHETGKLLLVNIGDSRLYRFRGGYLNQLSTDHSLREATGDVAIPDNLLLSSLGGGVANFDSQIVDLSGKLQPGDRVLVCSDGLYKELSVDELEEAFLRYSSIAGDFREVALAKGGSDNISVVLCDVVQD